MTDETEPFHSNGRVWFEEGLGDIQQDMGSKQHTLLLQVSNASVQHCNARLIMVLSAVH